MRYRDFPFQPVQRSGPTQLVGSYQPSPPEKSDLWKIAVLSLPVVLFVGNVLNNAYLHHRDRRFEERISALEGKKT